MVTNYSSWMGKPVIMNVMSGSAYVDLHCTVMKDEGSLVRVRLFNKWDVDIYKDMVGSVEPETGPDDAQVDKFFDD